MIKKKAKFGYKKEVKPTMKQKVLDPKLSKAGFTQDLIDTVIKKAAVERQNNLVSEIVDRLKTKGITFKTEEETVAFFKDRLKIATAGDKRYVFLDYVDNKNQGDLLLWYNENMEIQVKTDAKQSPVLNIV
jgi:hypothetical protein